MKIASLAALGCFMLVVGLAPSASATRIDFDKLSKYSIASDYGQKENKGSIISEFAKNGGFGALKSELKEWKNELKNGWQGGSYVKNTYVPNGTNGTSVASPETFLVFALGFVLLAGWHLWHQRSSRRMPV